MNPRQRVRDIKKFGPPLFKKGEKVKSCIHDKVVIIANDPWCNGFTWMYELENIEGSTGQDYLRKYSTPTSEEGTIVWHSIAEGNLPPEDTTDHHPNFSIKVLCYSHDEHSNNGIIREGRWHMKRGGWLVYDGGIKPTHWAYINYPEPENSVKEQSS